MTLINNFNTFILGSLNFKMNVGLGFKTHYPLKDKL